MSFLILRLFILKYHISLGIVNCPQDEDICITIKIQTMHSFYLSWDRNQFRFPILPWQPEPVPLSYTSLATGTSSAFPLSWRPEPVPLFHFPGNRNQFRFSTFLAQPEPVPLSYTSLATGTSSTFLHSPDNRNQFRFPTLPWRPEPVPLFYFLFYFPGDRN